VPSKKKEKKKKRKVFKMDHDDDVNGGKVNSVLYLFARLLNDPKANYTFSTSKIIGKTHTRKTD
jgi:hypothetical protein